MLYFGYGSNMCTERLRVPDRVPTARAERIAKLVGYTFRFNKKSQDCSKKTTPFTRANPADVVWGVVFKIDPAEKPRLDVVEGLGHGYAETVVTVAEQLGRNARQHGLPADYIALIEAVPAKEDPNQDRDAQNRAIPCNP